MPKPPLFTNLCKILIIYNNDFPESSAIDLGIEARASIHFVSEKVHKALKNLGYLNIDRFPVQSLSEIKKILAEKEYHLIFNLCETLNGDSRMEIEVVKLLEKYNIPFTGNSSITLEASLGKFQSTALLKKSNINVPESYLLKSLKDIDQINFDKFNFILKPNEQDGSTGIEFCSVVKNKTELLAQAKYLFDNNQGPIIVQQYIEGREINLAIMGKFENEFWNCSEIDFSQLPDNVPKILNYSSKWIEDSFEYKKTFGVQPILTASLKKKIFEIGNRTAQALGIISYARLDLRLDKNENPFVIDVNPNCDLDPIAGLTRSASYNGISYEMLILKIVKNAFEKNTESTSLDFLNNLNPFHLFLENQLQLIQVEE